MVRCLVPCAFGWGAMTARGREQHQSQHGLSEASSQPHSDTAMHGQGYSWGASALNRCAKHRVDTELSRAVRGASSHITLMFACT